MTDPAAPAIVSETPVNPYSLLEAVNRASRSASLAWLALLAVMAYLSVAVAGITHRDLLLDTDVVLPILQTKIGLKPFFVVAPLLFVLLHLAVIGQMALVVQLAALKMVSSGRISSSLTPNTIFFRSPLPGAVRMTLLTPGNAGIAY